MQVEERLERIEKCLVVIAKKVDHINTASDYFSLEGEVKEILEKEER